MQDFEVINENLRSALAAFSHVAAGGHTGSKPRLSFAYSGVPLGLFNTALLLEPPEPGGFDAFLRESNEWFEARSASWSLWFCENLLTPLQRREIRIALATRGMKQMMDAPGMIAQEIVPLSRLLPQLDCRPVNTEQTRRDFAAIMSSAFTVPEQMSRTVYASELLWRGPLRGWIAYAGKEAVSSISIVVGGEAIGVYAVATHPKHQRKGYAEALMRHAIGIVSEETGLQRSILQSSMAGYQMYSRMGYRQVARFLVYLSGE